MFKWFISCFDVVFTFKVVGKSAYKRRISLQFENLEFLTNGEYKHSLQTVISVYQGLKKQMNTTIMNILPQFSHRHKVMLNLYTIIINECS